MTATRTVMVSLFFWWACFPVLQAQEAELHRVEAGPFQKVIAASGRFEPLHIAALSADFRQFSSLKIDNLAADGTLVKEGEIVVRFDRRDYEKQMAIKAIDRAAARIALEIDRVEFDRDRQLNEMESEQLHKNLEYLIADRDYFLNIEHPQLVESTQKSQEWADDYLEDQREELRQLERMYQEDELIEESEELVLRRTRRSVAQSEFNHKRTSEANRRQLEDIIPRTLASKEIAFQMDRLKLETQINVARATAERRSIERDKAEREFDIAERDFAEFQDEGDLLDWEAPISGIWVHGEFDRGALTGTRKWKHGDSVNLSQCIGTVYQMSPLGVRADLTEEVVRQVRPGMPVAIAAKSNPEKSIEGQVEQIGLHALSNGLFDCVIRFEDQNENNLPGMTCDVKITVYTNPQAIAIPTKALFCDDQVNHYVFLKDGDSHRQVAVTPGHANEDSTEIVDGLKVGDMILLEKPE